MTYEPTIHICDNLLTKHLTHMAHISKPQVRNVRILQIRRLDLFKFEIFQTILRNRLTLRPIFSPAVYFHLQSSSDVIDLTGVFYQKIFQHILNGNCVLNKWI